jgi:hypothetical protein
MDRAELEGYLDGGLSFEAIGRLVDCDPSTVAYWAKKHGLRSAHAPRHAARGAIPREQLEELVADGLTIREVAAAVERSPATVRHWLRKYEITLNRRRGRKPRPIVGISGNGTIVAECPLHGAVDHTIDGRNHLRCLRCRTDAVVQRRRKVKEILVAEAGGRCLLCGYDRCLAALEFHHVDPADKAFHVSREGVTRSLAKARAEARKCVLLCSNCHVEVEAGIQALPLGPPPGFPG